MVVAIIICRDGQWICTMQNINPQKTKSSPRRFATLLSRTGASRSKLFRHQDLNTSPMKHSGGSPENVMPDSVRWQSGAFGCFRGLVNGRRINPLYKSPKLDSPI